MGHVVLGAMPGGVAISNRSTFAEFIRNLSLNPDPCLGAWLASGDDGVPVSLRLMCVGCSRQCASRRRLRRY